LAGAVDYALGWGVWATLLTRDSEIQKYDVAVERV
jgi:hypothetical protein